MIVLLLALLFPMAHADYFSEACALLDRPAIEKQFPGAKDLVCRGISAHCLGKTSAECGKTKACQPLFGSSSGPGCTPCVPDMVYQNCGDANRDGLAKTIINFAEKIKSK